MITQFYRDLVDGKQPAIQPGDTFTFDFHYGRPRRSPQRLTGQVVELVYIDDVAGPSALGAVVEGIHGPMRVDIPLSQVHAVRSAA